VVIYKIALVGKANSGKDTAARIIKKQINKIHEKKLRIKILAFAEPIKEMVLLMFPKISRDCIFGSSTLRNTIIEGAKDSDGSPLTIRRILLDIGTGLGRSYLSTIWIDNMAERVRIIEESDKPTGIIITDVRFRDEFDWLKNNGFFMVKVKRGESNTINHISEIEQETIQDHEYDFILYNSSTLKDLRKIVKKHLIPSLK
jgi:hypothetical protein